MKKLLTLIVFSVLLLVPVGTQNVFAHGLADVEQLSSTASTAGNDIWQSFTPTQNNIIGVDLKIASPIHPSSSPGTIRIYGGEGTGGPLLATSSITILPVLNQFQHFDFDTAVDLSSCNPKCTYRLTVPVVSVGFIDLDTTNPYPLGRTNFDPNWDFLFRTYYSPNACHSSYHLNTNILSFNDAEAAAVGFGGQLATIRSSSQNAEVVTVAGGNTAWIGFNDRTTEGTFVWTSGDATPYTNWRSGEPNDAGGNEDATEMLPTGFWNDGEVTTLRTSVYEILDTDCDGVDDNVDVCQGFDDAIDTDGDGVPDGCDSLNACHGSYNLNTNILSFNDAEAAAVGLGGHLATIRSSSQNTEVLAVAGGNEVLFGFNDIVTEGTFEWTSGDAIPYTNWGAGEPNNAAGGTGEDAASLGPPTGFWNDIPVATLLPSVYEIFDTDCDGVDDNADVCQGFHDAVDADFDGVPDGCDVCSGFDDNLDSDGDMIPDGCDPNTEITTNTVAQDTTFGGDLTVDGASFTIPFGITVEFDFVNNKIIVKNPNGKILIEFGGKIT